MRIEVRGVVDKLIRNAQATDIFLTIRGGLYICTLLNSIASCVEVGDTVLISADHKTVKISGGFVTMFGGWLEIENKHCLAA